MYIKTEATDPGLDRRLSEGERLNVASFLQVRGKPQKLTFQACYKHLNASRPMLTWECKYP